MNSAILAIVDLKKHFNVHRGIFKPPDVVYAVDGVSFKVGQGEIFGLVGESGCGKTTLGRMVLRLIEPTDGKILFYDRNLVEMTAKELKEIRKEVQIIFQDPYSSLNPRKKVGTIVGEPLLVNRVDTNVKERVYELLETVGLRGDFHADRYPHQFSGGQRQRIVIARALAVNPKLLVCDEPVSALDVSIQSQIINLLQRLKSRFHLSMIFISHDLSVVRHMCDRIAVMYLGKIMEIAPVEALFSEPLHPYTRALLAAVPIPEVDVPREDFILGGEVPSPMNPPPGCRFHTRCRDATERCRREEPVLRTVGKGHQVACWTIGR